MCFFSLLLYHNGSAAASLNWENMWKISLFLSNNIKNRMIKIKKNTEIYIYYMLMSIKVDVDCNIDCLQFT